MKALSHVLARVGRLSASRRWRWRRQLNGFLYRPRAAACCVSIQAAAAVDAEQAPSILTPPRPRRHSDARESEEIRVGERAA